MVGLLVSKAFNKIIQRCLHGTHAACIHHIGAADSLGVHSVSHQLIRGHVSCLEKSHQEYKITSMINWFNMFDLLDVEKIH